MEFVCHKSDLFGSVDVPASKSHTIRGVLLASLADGESTLLEPLTSEDTAAAISVYRQLGAEFEMGEREWRIKGTGCRFRIPDETLDVKNSGTTLRVVLGSASLLPEGEIRITGDRQIQSRPNGPLVDALNDLGAHIESDSGDGCVPFRIRGVLRGGRTGIEAKTSQYVTSLLLCCPLAANDTEIDVLLLHEKPYVHMTLDWLRHQEVRVEHEKLRRFHIPGGQQFRPFTRRIPADFSSATFFLVAGALGNNEIVCRGLDMKDSQADKAVVGFLQEMGAVIEVSNDAVAVRSAQLRGVDIDMNDCPDALPMMAVAGCFANGTTRLLNVPQARIKETDRIAVMCTELKRRGADIEELPDGLVIHESRLQGGPVNGHSDHRVVMAMAMAGTLIPGTTRVTTAEAAAVTFPQFAEFIQALGGDLIIR